MIIYRIEHKNEVANTSNRININKGPYGSFYNMTYKDILKHQQMSMSHARGNNHPNIWCDMEGLVHDDEISKFYCGCPNLDILKEWFSGYVANLLRNEYQVVEYKVKQSVLGWSGRQSFFKPSEIISKKVVRIR